MKFGETASSIYAYSFSVQEGYSTPAWPYDKTVKVLKAIDGSIIDNIAINFGARQHRTAQFNLNYMTRADHYTLKTYFDANRGLKIRVELENTGERVFGEQYAGTVYYAYLLEADSIGETQFSAGHTMYGYTLKLDFAGTASNSVPNPVDTSDYDFLIVLDCVRVTAGCQVANLTALNAITNKPGGSRGLTVDNRKVYFWNAALLVWQYQYTAPANDPAQGLKNGVFRLSAFADISGSSAGISTALGSPEDFKAGWIVEKSIKFPRYSVDARQGPAIEHPEGFSFAIDNSARRWKYPLENNLAFYGAYCQLYVYDRLAGVLVLQRSGFNNRNTFDYTRFDFEIEPGVFLQNKSFPTSVIGKDNYPNAAESMRGKTVLATYGRWDKGALQVIDFAVSGQKLPGGRRYLGFIGYDIPTKLLTVDVASTEFTKLLGLAVVSDYPGAAPTKYIYAQIIQQDSQPDINKLAKIDVISTIGANTGLTLNKAFTKDPDGSSIIQIYLSNVELIIDSAPTVGLRKPEYLLSAPEGATTIPRQLYAKVGNVLEQVPDAYYSAVGTEENEFTLNGQALDVDNFNTVTLKDSVELTRIAGAQISAVLCPGTIVKTYDFGFVPDGMKSEILTAFHYDSDNGVHTTAIASSDRITVAWSQRGTGKYKLYRYKFPKVDRNFQVNGAGPFLDTVIVIASYLTTFYVDTSLDAAFTYMYRIQTTDNSGVPTSDMGLFEYTVGRNNGYKLDPKNSSGVALKVKPAGNGSTEVTLVWNKMVGQRQVKIFRDGVLLITLDTTTGPYLNATAYQVASTGSDSAHEFYIQVSISNTGNNADRWYIPDGSALTNIWGVQANTDLTSVTKYLILEDSYFSESQTGYKVKNTAANSGAGIPAAGIVYTWMLKVDKTKFPDLSNAKDVRLLTDFVIRSFYDAHTQVPVIIQLRAVKVDGKSFVVQQHSSSNAGQACKEKFRGAFAQFLNLPTSKSGADVNYETDAQGTNANGLYTGKDMWAFPDWLFADNAAEWNKVEYLVFAVTNAVFIAPEPAFNHGYRIGLGGLAGDAIDFVKVHKDKYYVEYVKEFEGGLDSAQYARIDGGRIDDASGSITDTPNRIIEKARHVIDHVVNSMLGFKPICLGNEMRSRNGWLWRWQTKESRSMLDTLQTLAHNIHGIFTLTPDDKLYLRSLDINSPNSPSVYTFNDSNIIVDTLGKPEYRRRNEIYQKFRLKYNIEPSKDGKATEEMLIGWDLATSLPILSGYKTTVEGTGGVLEDTGGDNGLASTLCRLSTQLYAAGVGINEFGAGESDEKIYEMFYRPTKASSLTAQPVERDLPNLNNLWGVDVKPPKMAMQDLAKMVVEYFCYDSWYFPLSISMKNLIYNPSVNGVKDEAGTADRKLKLGDVVTINSHFHTGGLDVKVIILDIEPKFYDGMATIHVFAPRPPGQLGTAVDPVWDAGGPGPRNEADFVFKGNLYGLLSEAATFADAGAPGARNEANMKFPDGTFADPKGAGAGKA